MDDHKLVDLPAILRERGWPRALGRAAGRVAERVLSIDRLNRIEAETAAAVAANRGRAASFFMTTLRVMDVQFELATEDFERIPKEGPLIVVANHPFGGIDGVVLGAMLQGVRSDAKILGNFLLGRIRGIRESIIEVDPFAGEGAARSNLKGMRQMIAWLKEGGCLGIFPSGEVSSFQWKDRSICDPAWTSHVVNLARRTNAPILPVHFSGRNGDLFQALGFLHPRIRTLLLPREFCRAAGTEMRVRVGRIIPPARLERFDSDSAATDFLRLQTYALPEAARPAGKQRRLRFPFRSVKQGRASTPLAPAQPAQVVRSEVDSLPEERLLVEHGNLRVYYAAAEEIPRLLLEIGRLREETFRAVREGTGADRDLDSFDGYYYHLFMWNREASEIVGAYRIGLVDEIVAEHGPEGLYSHTLFNFKKRFIERLGPAIELGRSFVCLKYQRKPTSLSLIWRGIGEFVVRYPRYKTLFGPVSITQAYNSISKDLMVHFFKSHNFDVKMARFVKARNPPRSSTRIRGISLKRLGKSLGSVDAVSSIVSGFEEDEKGIPVLLRHYLKLNGVILSFNLDPAFSDVIDGLILVDLMKSDSKILERYMGKEGYAAFMRVNAGPEASVVV